MDIDLLNSPTQDEHQMEIMMTMMMDKFPEFCGPYNEAAADFPPTDSTGTNVGAIPHFIDNMNTTSFTNTQSSMSFSGSNPVEEPPAPPFWSRGRGEVPQGASNFSSPLQKRNSMAAMREMIFRIAAMQPIHIDPESVKPPKRRNVKISKDPQSVAARHRRERISERIRILQRLVPGGTKMDTASMLDEAIHYVKFLKMQVQSLERAAANRQTGIGFPVAVSNGSYMPMAKVYQPVSQNVQHYGDA